MSYCNFQFHNLPPLTFAGLERKRTVVTFQPHPEGSVSGNGRAFISLTGSHSESHSPKFVKRNPHGTNLKYVLRRWQACSPDVMAPEMVHPLTEQYGLNRILLRRLKSLCPSATAGIRTASTVSLKGRFPSSVKWPLIVLTFLNHAFPRPWPDCRADTNLLPVLPGTTRGSLPPATPRHRPDNLTHFLTC